jgi:hypothetical protein
VIGLAHRNARQSPNAGLALLPERGPYHHDHPLGTVAAGANRHDAPLLGPTLDTLDTLDRLGPLPPQPTMRGLV